MKQTKLIHLTLLQLKQLYQQNLPEVTALANQTDSPEEFTQKLRDFLQHHKQPENQTVQHLLAMLAYNGQTVFELSCEELLTINTFGLLWEFLNDKLNQQHPTDLFLDLYQQFNHLDDPVATVLLPSDIKNRMKKWPTGLDPEIVKLREENRERMIPLLVRKIENRHNPASKYIFAPDDSYEEKYRKVALWWNDARFQLAMAIKSPSDLQRFLNFSLSEDTMELLNRGRKKGMPFFATPYYLSLLNTREEGFDDTTIRSYILYSPELVDTYGNIRAWEREDKVKDGEPNAAGWVLPAGNNIHRRYPEVAILIPDSMGRACGGLCASCQRMYDFQSKRLNFEFEELKVKESWDKKLRRLMLYFEEDTQLQDILITGGDALMSQNKTLRNILEAVYKMAVRKRKANLLRKDGEKYAELQRVRLGSRLPAYLPMRINEELVTILKEFKEKAEAVGIKQFIIQTHFQSPLEVTPEAEEAINRILASGWTITNQLVYTVAASRIGHTARLRQVLNSKGVLCYYTFSVKGFKENYAVFTPNSRSLQEQHEEKIAGRISPDQQQQLVNLLNSSKNIQKDISQFLKSKKLPFLATDRSVLNLPAIGKSMTFITVGITADGRRVLRFEHDHGRKHSPIIDRMKHIYIVENRSIRSYLSQLGKMGENVNDYQSIWKYTSGETEPRFSLYEYPDYDFEITDQISNIEIDGQNK